MDVALWNLALDENYGPHLGGWGTAAAWSPSIRPRVRSVTRNLEYYALAHASRFVRPGAVRLESTTSDSLETVGFRNADDRSKLLLVLNAAATPREFAVRSGTEGFTYTLPGGGVATFTWRR